MMGYRQQRPKIGLTVCPDLVDHYTSLVRKQKKIASRLASENSFEALAREWHHSQLALWSSGHATRVIESLEADAFPELGLVPVTELTAPMMLNTLRKVEKRGGNGNSRADIATV